jgi:hypothetical protein
MIDIGICVQLFSMLRAYKVVSASDELPERGGWLPHLFFFFLTPCSSGRVHICFRLVGGTAYSGILGLLRLNGLVGSIFVQVYE